MSVQSGEEIGTHMRRQNGTPFAAGKENNEQALGGDTSIAAWAWQGATTAPAPLPSPFTAMPLLGTSDGPVSLESQLAQNKPQSDMTFSIPLKVLAPTPDDDNILDTEPLSSEVPLSSAQAPSTPAHSSRSGVTQSAQCETYYGSREADGQLPIGISALAIAAPLNVSPGPSLTQCCRNSEAQPVLACSGKLTCHLSAPPALAALSGHSSCDSLGRQSTEQLVNGPLTSESIAQKGSSQQGASKPLTVPRLATTADGTSAGFGSWLEVNSPAGSKSHCNDLVCAVPGQSCITHCRSCFPRCTAHNCRAL